MRLSVLPFLLVGFAFWASACDSTPSADAEVLVGSWEVVDLRIGSNGTYTKDETAAFEAAGISVLTLGADGTATLTFTPKSGGQLDVDGVPVVALTALDQSGTYAVQAGASPEADDDGVITFSASVEQEGQPGAEVTIEAPYRLQGSDRFRLDIDAAEAQILLGLDAPIALGARLTLVRRS